MSMLPTPISATDLAEMTGNQTEDENMKTFMKMQTQLPVRSLGFRKRDLVE